MARLTVKDLMDQRGKHQFAMLRVETLEVVLDFLGPDARRKDNQPGQGTDDDGVYARLNNSMDNSYGEESLDGSHDNDDDADQMSGGDHSQTAKNGYQVYLPTWLNAQQQMQHDASSSSLWSFTSNEKCRCISAYFGNREDLMHNLFLGELGLWAAAFVGLGCWAAS